MGNTQQKGKISTDHYSCPNCGAGAEFNTKTQTLSCPYCASQIVIDNQSAIAEQDINNLFSDAKVWSDAEIIQCENCGAKESISKGQIATHCSFCGTTNIVKTSEIVGMTPHGICTFQFDNKQAAAFAKKWAKKQRFAPNKFKKSAEAKAISGVYSPAFTFDCETDSEYKGRLGRTKYRTVVGSNGKLREESYTDYFRISGNHSAVHDDIIVHASSNIPNTMLDGLGDYPTKTSVSYDQRYLAGYTANTYAKDGQQAWAEGKAKIDGIIKKQVLKKYTHDVVDSFEAKTTYKNRSFKYLLLPVFIGHYKFKEKLYNFYVNGCTGKVSGKAPVSWVKVLFTVLAGIAIIGAFVYLHIFLNR